MLSPQILEVILKINPTDSSQVVATSTKLVEIVKYYYINELTSLIPQQVTKDLTIYLVSASTPTTPSGGSYNFATDTLTAPTGGWTRSLQSNTSSSTALYASTATAAGILSNQSGADTDSTLQWSAPAAIAKNGIDATPPLLVKISATNNIFRLNAIGTPDLDYIEFTDISENVPANATKSWECTGGTLTNISSSIQRLFYTDTTSKTITVTRTINDIKDQITIVVLQEGVVGADGVTPVIGVLSNEMHSVPAYTTGEVIADGLSGCFTRAYAYEGTLNITSSYTWTNGYDSKPYRRYKPVYNNCIDKWLYK